MSDSRTDEIRIFYNQRWLDNRFQNSLKLARAAAIINEVFDTKIENPRFLDFGCGTGWLADILSHFGPADGVDLSDEAIDLATQNFPHACFACQDFMNWADIGKIYDIVVSQEVIEHIVDQRKYMALAGNLLRPGGYLILTTPNRYIFDTFSVEQKQSWSNQPIENLLTRSELKKLLPAGLSLIKMRTIIPGYDPKGALRLLTSHRLKGLLEKVGLLRIHSQACLRIGWGLHILLVAKKI